MNPFGEAPLSRIEAGIEEQAGHAQHTIHGGAQLVAHTRHKIALRPRENLQLLVSLLQLVGAIANGMLQLTTIP